MQSPKNHIRYSVIFTAVACFVGGIAIDAQARSNDRCHTDKSTYYSKKAKKYIQRTQKYCLVSSQTKVVRVAKRKVARTPVVQRMPASIEARMRPVPQYIAPPVQPSYPPQVVAPAPAPVPVAPVYMNDWVNRNRGVDLSANLNSATTLTPSSRQVVSYSAATAGAIPTTGKNAPGVSIGINHQANFDDQSGIVKGIYTAAGYTHARGTFEAQDPQNSATVYAGSSRSYQSNRANAQLGLVMLSDERKQIIPYIGVQQRDTKLDLSASQKTKSTSATLGLKMQYKINDNVTFDAYGGAGRVLKSTLTDVHNTGGADTGKGTAAEAGLRLNYQFNQRVAGFIEANHRREKINSDAAKTINPDGLNQNENEIKMGARINY